MKTIANRRFWLVPRDQPLRCPHEDRHRMREDAIFPEQGAMRCKAKLAAGAHGQPSAECGTWLYAVHLRNDRRLVAEVTHDELRYIEAEAMSVDQVLAFLGADGPLRRQA